LNADYSEIRTKFGKVFKIWFSRNNWPQDVPHKLSAFMPTGGPWNSQISTAMAAKLDPKIGFFLACGEFNRVIASQKFPGVIDARLISLLRGAQPLTFDNGEIFKATDFFELFSGITQPPAEYQLPEMPDLTDEGAKQVCNDIRSSFAAAASKRFLAPPEAWGAMEPTLSHLTGVDRNRFRDVLCGWSNYSAAELNTMPSNATDGETTYAPELWIKEYGELN
jgi:hypothetical protein